MKAVLANSRTGEISLHDVPNPEQLAGGIIVETHFSVISSGTERAKVETGEKWLLGKAMARPDLVRQVLEHARAHGIREAYEKVRVRLEGLLPMGYSCSGVVSAVGEGVNEFRVGDRVACAGVGYANHSEVNFIPRNLAVPVPLPVSLEHAAITTIGAIAMQGLRQAHVSFGETVVVIGVGLVGVLAVQLARAAGCRVVAIDIDPGRAQRAVSLGAGAGFSSADSRLPELVSDFSRCGGDIALITAATRSSEPLELATRILRDRGRIVIVGDVGLDVPRDLLYGKELSIALSRSYGPGRYDPAYEERGIDYPIGYVRWTEKRNMEAFLDYLAAGTIDVAPILEHQRTLEEAPKAYEDIRHNRAYTVLIRYPASCHRQALATTEKSQPDVRPRPQEGLRLGCIGAGSFARGVIFPRLRKIHGVGMEAVATSTGIGAVSAKKAVGFHRACTPDELVIDPNVDAFFILTRHDSHARYLLRVLPNRKPIFIEKPLCVRREELTAIRTAYSAQAEQGATPFVMVGFNRRFSPLTQKVREFFGGHKEPMVVHIRVNAGYLPPDHWVQITEGGRIVGELCHFVDWARFVVGRPMVSVSAVSLPDGSKYNRDNTASTLVFQDGSIADLIYVANGDRAVPKEYFEVFCEGAVARLDDFCCLELSRGGKRHRYRSSQDKGYTTQLALTTEAMLLGRPSPIAFEEFCEVTEITFRIEEALGKQSLATPVEAHPTDLAVETLGEEYHSDVRGD
jgi:predicted dehydrogenase/threonine dehydrogenase-like Zn-dependent dehydrogenase